MANEQVDVSQALLYYGFGFLSVPWNHLFHPLLLLKKRISVKTFSNPAGSLIHAILKDSLGNSGKSCAEMNDDSPGGSWVTRGVCLHTLMGFWGQPATRSLQVIRMNQNGFRLVCLKMQTLLTSPSHWLKGEALQAWWAGFPSTCCPPAPCCTPGLAVAAAGPLTLRLAATAAAFPTQGLAGRSWRGTGFYWFIKMNVALKGLKMVEILHWKLK